LALLQIWCAALPAYAPRIGSAHQG